MLRKIDLLQLNDPTIDLDEMRVKFNFSAKVCDMADEVIVEAVVDAAKEAGITHLYLLDRNFILDAIREKADRDAFTWSLEK